MKDYANLVIFLNKTAKNENYYQIFRKFAKNHSLL